MTVRAFALTAALVAAVPAAAGDRFATYANPLDLPYRFQSPGAVRREAADPAVVVFRGEYWLFASKSRGYWHSRDLKDWRFVAPTGLPLDAYAPAPVVIDGRLFVTMGSGVTKLYTTDDPARGAWRVAGDFGEPYYDPGLFRDDDGRIYMVDGLSAKLPIRVTELDPKTWHPLRRAAVPASRDTARRGWEVPGDANDRPDLPTWIEGGWLSKHGGRYWLQNAAPGTEYQSYADGVLVGDTPLGPFAAVASSPLAIKPTGFIAGAGHGASFAGRDGRWWQVGSLTISQRHVWERRIGLWPVAFAADGAPVADTWLGDWPHRLGGDRGLAGWMLLSRGKPATASSSAPGREPAMAADDNVRTWWAAASAAPGEWYRLDLGPGRTVEAVQLNFADDGAAGDAAGPDVFRYRLEASLDGTRWRTLVDTGARSARDAPHDYRVLPRATPARYLRLTDLHTPYGARFSLYDLRVFGHADVPPPAAVTGVVATRDPADPRHATIRWTAPAGADFAIVRLGPGADAMGRNYQAAPGATSLDVRSLDAGVAYLVAVDAVNERAVTRGAPAATLAR